MISAAPSAIDAQSLLDTGIQYSICTLVTRAEQYADMEASFRSSGFGGADCEFIKIDNTARNRLEAYAGNNLFLTVARGEYIILCHQDIILIDNRQTLESLLLELNELDPLWAACGNAGGLPAGDLAIRISDPHGDDQRAGALPARVNTLDENFILVRRSANLSVSADLAGFHLYGSDLCIIADVLGRSAYVIDFHLRHLSPGKRDETLADARRRLVAKYVRAFRPRWVRTTCEMLYLSSFSWLSRVMSSRWSMWLTHRLHRRR